jgi:hypothetical protein
MIDVSFAADQLLLTNLLVAIYALLLLLFPKPIAIDLSAGRFLAQLQQFLSRRLTFSPTTGLHLANFHTFIE